MNDFVQGFRLSGSVLYGEENLYGTSVNPMEIWVHIGMVFQKPNPFPKSIFENIAERALELNEEPQLKPYINIPRMAEHAQRMVKEALDTVVTRNSQLARKVCRDDDFVDGLTHQIFRELLTYMMEDPHSVSRAVRITFVAKYLERVADHATNVAELVVYLLKER